MVVMTRMSLAVLAAVTMAGLAACGEQRRAAERQARARASSPSFDVFHVGAIFVGLPMTEAVREHIAPDSVAPELGRQDSVTYLYGDCPPLTAAEAKTEGGCLPPLEIQSTPLCEKHARLYRNPDVGAWDYESKTIKGVPGASFDGGRILEIYITNTTISIHGQRPELVLRAASALRKAPKTSRPASSRCTR